MTPEGRLVDDKLMIRAIPGFGQCLILIHDERWTSLEWSYLLEMRFSMNLFFLNNSDIDMFPLLMTHWWSLMNYCTNPCWFYHQFVHWFFPLMLLLMLIYIDVAIDLPYPLLMTHWWSWTNYWYWSSTCYWSSTWYWSSIIGIDIEWYWYWSHYWCWSTRKKHHLGSPGSTGSTGSTRRGLTAPGTSPSGAVRLASDTSSEAGALRCVAGCCELTLMTWCS